MDKYAELREALEIGPTPGPWRFINHNNKPAQSLPSDDWTIKSETNGKVVCSEPQCKFADLPTVCDGPYIAACHPEAIRALLAERDALREVLEASIEQMEYDAAKIDWEWGGCRSIDELERDGDLPEAIVLARAALAHGQGVKHDNQD